MSKIRTPLILFITTVILIALLALFGPEEKSLGSNVRIVYLHGAWVLAAEIAFFAAAIAGAIGLIAKRAAFHRWSAALGRTGIFFWLTYLPLSLWAMESNWNGLFLSEPRFRLAAIFAVTGVLLQVGLWMININWVTSLANIIYVIVLRVAFSSASNIMHPPPSPIFNSGNYLIIGFFLAMIILTLVAAYFLTLVFLNLSKEST
ncbi:MAG: hypothetical protein ACM3XO_06110 [Bacteroidota bacterium]|jgi:hypothetical protein